MKDHKGWIESVIFGEFEASIIPCEQIPNHAEYPIFSSSEKDLYHYDVYGIFTKLKMTERHGDSVWTVKHYESGTVTATVKPLSKYVYREEEMAGVIGGMQVVIRGYTCGRRSTLHETISTLPYINGCSTDQIIHPMRPGDPTLQSLYIPPYTKEQAHHIHSTTRIIYVAKGSGESIVGMPGHVDVLPLKPGTIMKLDKMVPHHFQTSQDSLIVYPLHIFSATPLETSHPMKNGTIEV